MRRPAILLTTLALAATAPAQSPKAYQNAELLKMESVACGSHLCREYVLQTDKAVYRLRPRSEKHAAMLPVGERVQFRLDQQKFLLRLQGAGEDKQEREYIVTSVAARGESTADATPVHLNHLQ
jgi:hypothetical protein